MKNKLIHYKNRAFMKTLVIGIGAFGFAVLNHLSKNNKDKEFFGFEKNQETLSYLQKTRENPYFFSGVKLGENVVFLDNLEKLGDFDLVIIAIPAQFVGSFVDEIKLNLKPGVTILNLSKGIDNKTLKTTSGILKEKLGNFNYNYAILSGGMIAGELVEGKILGATIGTENIEIGMKLKEIFEGENLKINLDKNYINIELFGSIKNIFALYMGYLEGKGFGMSSIGYYFCELYRELPELLKILSGEKNIDFSDFALGGDLIATCFGNSRNRYFGQIVGSGKTPQEAEETLKQEKKHAEGYYTLLGIKEIILKSDLENFKKIITIFE